MKTILALIWKDVQRDAKHPWPFLLFGSIPLIMTALMAAIFGGAGGRSAMPTIHVAVLDQDQDMISSVLKSLSSQGDSARNLQLHLVETRSEGIKMLEKRKASAFITLPKHLTTALLDGTTNAIEVYENPAEQALPKIVFQGVSLLACGLSGAADLLGEPLRGIRALVHTNEFPADAAVMATTLSSVQQLRQVRNYLFPPLIQFQTVKASDFILPATKTITPRP